MPTENNIDRGFHLNWQNFITSVGLVFILVGGFWTLAYIPIQASLTDLKLEIKEMKQQTETRRTEIATRNDVQSALQTTRVEFTAEVKRLDQSIAGSMKRSEFDTWKSERDRLIESIQHRINRLYGLYDEINKAQKKGP